VGFFDRLDRLADQLGDLIVPDDVRAHVELGAAYLERGDLDNAVRELERACELRPDHPRASYLLGVAYARRGESDAAVTVLSRAAASTGRGGPAEAHVALGELFRDRGDLGAAEDAYRAALDGDLGDSALRAEVYRGLGAVYLAAHRYDKAVRELRKAAASLPDDAEAQALLGRALQLRGDLDAARVCLERATRGAHADAAALAALGELYERQGRDDDARAAFARAIDGEAAPATGRGLEAEVTARLGLARLALACADLGAAHEHVLRALAIAPARPDILVLQARVSAAALSWEPALALYDRALVADGGAPSRLLFDRRPVLEEALRVALRAGLVQRAKIYADALVGDGQPDHADALAAQALAAAQAGERERAESLVARALAAGDTVETRLAAAELAPPATAAASLRRAAMIAPADPRPRARLAELYRRERDSAPRELYGLIAQAHRHLSRNPELAELGPEAGRLLETLDRPLLVTVMGEFNAGKSTFVNALIGEEVAPMGITPTTATINVLKYGAERKARVVYFDDTSRDVAWVEVPALLRGLQPDEARRIRVVEVLYPTETLQRVNVVDTPGLNSIHPEHEDTARRFIGEADAVVWLFSVDQAGKATEEAALERIRGEGKKVLGVLNKIDRCSDDELRQIVAHVQTALGEWLETVVPFSAREALAGRAGDAARLARSNYEALVSTLEERFFSRARAIQRDAARLRLRALLERARALGATLVGEDRAAPIAAALTAVRADALLFERQFLTLERRRLAEAGEAVYVACADEVLDFVRPRRWVFGSNEAAPADRDFLLGLLEERLGGVLDASRGRVAAEIERSVTSARAPFDGAGDAADAELRLLDEQVYGRFRAFARGYLRGGRVDDFFTHVLPKLALEAREIRRALERNAPWSDELVASELRAPLRAWGERFFAGLTQRLERARSAVELERFEIEERVIAPVELIAAALE
jgi:tetratricopeptide (TPR) repeat protein/GTP-binding protein EngB required for normal cell division